MLKRLFIDTIILDNSFPLMLYPKLETLDVKEVFAFFFALEGWSLDGDLNEVGITF
jgi:hypothetical protein